MNSENKVALITGSTSGIGLAIAETFAAAGYAVTLNGLGDAAAIEALRGGLTDRHGVAVDYHPADMTQPAAIAGMIADTVSRLGRVDIVVNNAGIQHVAPVDDFPPEKWDAIIAINLSAAFHVTRCTVPHMKAQGWGRIINIASAHALVASPFKSAYVAAKHGLAGLTKSVALELAQHNITCNAICPGYVKTPLVEGQIAATARTRGMAQDDVIANVILAAQPTKMFTEAADIGALAVFLCSDAARNITGAMLPVDGGWTAA